MDCSKLQLGRGRLDDTVSSFRRRLEQFRELTLPMLKVLDAEGRLAIVDGDTDNPSVQREFERVIRQHTSRLNHEVAYKPQSMQRQNNQSKAQQPAKQQKQQQNHDSIVEDLDNMPGAVPTISNHISLIHNNNKGSMENNDNLNNNTNHVSNHVVGNNHVNEAKAPANPTKTFRSMLEESETYAIDEA